DIPMRLSTNLIALLRNFSKINPSLRFEKGDLLGTIDKRKMLIAIAKLDEECPQEAYIYSLKEFLSLIARSEHPLQFSFDTTASETFPHGCVTVQEVESLKMIGSVTLCPANCVKTPPEKRISLEYDLAFDLTAADLVHLKKQSDYWHKKIVICSSGDTVQLQKMSDRDYASGLIEVCNTAPGTAPLWCAINTEYFKCLMPGPYSVQISKKGLAYFLYKGFPLEYWIVTERKTNDS
ncbi:MAG: hypothetical protein ACREJN_17825, partial [Nitrospiraceae bacterium]